MGAHFPRMKRKLLDCISHAYGHASKLVMPQILGWSFDSLTTLRQAVELARKDLGGA